MLLAEPLTDQVIGPAIEVHRHTGPSLLESVYEQCRCHELRDAGIAFARQVAISIVYRGPSLIRARQSVTASSRISSSPTASGG